MFNLRRLELGLRKFLEKPLVKGIFWKFTARMSSLFLQSFYFLIIARTLGTEQYGLFVGVMALIKLLVPFSAWGSPHILIKHVSRDRSVFNQYWGNSLSLTLVLGTFFIFALLLFKYIFLSSQFSWVLLLSLGLAELIFARVHDTAIKAFMATDHLKLDAQINIMLSLNGLIAALSLLIFFPQASAITWGFLYLTSRLVTAIISFFLVCQTLGWPQPDLSLMKPEMTQGFYFSLGLSSQTVYNDIDKIMLASMSTLSATGIYGAAYRLIEVAMIPIVSVLGASYAHFFRKGATGISGSLSFAKRIMPITGTYGFMASAGVWLFAPLIPSILGADYADSVGALQWLSPIIFFKSMQFFAADTLTGAGLQGARSILQAFSAGANALLNFWLIPLYSWKGAAWSSLGTDGLLVICLWALVFYYSRQEKHRFSS